MDKANSKLDGALRRPTPAISDNGHGCGAAQQQQGVYDAGTSQLARYASILAVEMRPKARQAGLDSFFFFPFFFFASIFSLYQQHKAWCSSGADHYPILFSSYFRCFLFY